MLIFIIPSWYKSYRFPENSIFIFEQAQALLNLGHKVVVLSVQPISIKSLRFANNRISYIDDNGISTYYTEVSCLKPSFFHRTYIKLFHNALDKLFKQALLDFGKPQVIYAHFTYPGGYCAAFLKEKHHIPLVIEEHYSGLMNPHISKTLKQYLRKAIDSSDKFICVSEGLRQSILNTIGKNNNLIVVPNMINSCFALSKNENTNYFNFFSMGSLIPRKGFDVLIHAFHRSFYNKKHITLTIAGQGPEHDDLEKLIDLYSLKNQVKLIGQLDRKQTLEAYKYAHCFVLASKAETYGIVYREAMAVGRPIISTKHGGFSDIDWHNEYGYLIETDNIDQLSQAMIDIYTNYSKFNQSLISDLCLSDCSENTIIHKIERVLIESTEQKRNGFSN